MVAWSLIHEVWFYLVFALILLLPERWVPLAFASWLIAVLCASLLVTTPVSSYLRVMKHEFTIEFIFGALAGIAYLKVAKGAIKNLNLSSLLALLGIGGIAYAMFKGTVDGSDVIQSISLERAVFVGGGYTLNPGVQGMPEPQFIL